MRLPVLAAILPLLLGGIAAENRRKFDRNGRSDIPTRDEAFYNRVSRRRIAKRITKLAKKRNRAA